MGKLTAAELTQHIWETCLEVLGSDGLAYEPGYELRRPSGISREAAATPPCVLKYLLQLVRRPTRSRWAPRRSCATSWASESSGFRVNPVSTRIAPGRTMPGVGRPG